MPFFRHAHHTNYDGIFIEWHPEWYYEERIKEIETVKALDEPSWKIELRKKLFGEIKLPAELNKAGAEWDKAGAELNKARAEWDKARAEWNKAGAEWDKALKAYGLERLHRELCLPDCPWDGRTIFGK